MKNIKNIFLKTVLLSMIVNFIGCQEDEYSFGEVISPSNIQITTEIVGADADNPNGDGSGVVNFSVSADNAVSYKFSYDGTEILALSGKASISFSNLGLNTYTVTVVATGTGGVATSKSIDVEVLSTYSPPQELKTKLFGFDPANPDAVTSRTWKVHDTKNKHFGLGPVAGTTVAEWYGAGPGEKVGVGMYDDRFTFSSDGTFSHVTNGTIFGRDPYIVNDLGPNISGVPNGADIENYAFSDYQETYTLTAPGGIERISLSGTAFIGYYTGGDHSYEIYDRGTPNELVLRTTDENAEFDWWFVITLE